MPAPRSSTLIVIGGLSTSSMCRGPRTWSTAPSGHSICRASRSSTTTSSDNGVRGRSSTWRRVRYRSTSTTWASVRSSIRDPDGLVAISRNSRSRIWASDRVESRLTVLPWFPGGRARAPATRTGSASRPNERSVMYVFIVTPSRRAARNAERRTLPASSRSGLVDVLERARHLVRREAFAQEGDQLVVVQRPRGLHDGMWHRAEIGVRQPHDAAAQHGRVLVDRGLDLGRVHVRTAHQDHVGVAVGQVDEPVLVHVAHVAQALPAARGAPRLRAQVEVRRLGTLAAAHPDPAGGAGRHHLLRRRPGPASRPASPGPPSRVARATRPRRCASRPEPLSLRRPRRSGPDPTSRSRRA